MTDNVLQLWRFVRGELSVPEAARWARATPELEGLLGANLHRRLCEVEDLFPKPYTSPWECSDQGDPDWNRISAHEEQLDELRHRLVSELNRHQMTDTVLQLWRFVRGELSVPEAARWARATPELEGYLGAGLHRRLCQVEDLFPKPYTSPWERWRPSWEGTYAHEKQLGEIRRLLVLELDRHHPRACMCLALKNDFSIDMGPVWDDVLVKAPGWFVPPGEYTFTTSDGWVHRDFTQLQHRDQAPAWLARCSACWRYWYIAQDDGADLFYFHLLSDAELIGMRTGEWPSVFEFPTEGYWHVSSRVVSYTYR